MHRAMLFTLLAVAAMLPAKADWQYTHWGMTRDEVIAAAHGDAKLDPGGERDRVWDLDRGLSGSYSEYGIAFHSEFYFHRDGKLAIVRLTAVDPANCDALRQAVEAAYGKPAQAEDVSPNPRAVMYFEYWRDVAHGNGVRYSHAQAGTFNLCFTAFVPLDNVDDNGVPRF